MDTNLKYSFGFGRIWSTSNMLYVSPKCYGLFVSIDITTCPVWQSISAVSGRRWGRRRRRSGGCRRLRVGRAWRGQRRRGRTTRRRAPTSAAPRALRSLNVLALNALITCPPCVTVCLHVLRTDAELLCENEIRRVFVRDTVSAPKAWCCCVRTRQSRLYCTL